MFNLSLHVGWGEHQGLVVVIPELLVVWLGGGSVNLEGVESEMLPDLLSVSKSWVVGGIELSRVESYENVSDVSSMSSDEIVVSLNGGGVNSISSNGVLQLLFQGMLSVEAPHSKVVWFIWWLWESFVWVFHFKSLEDFWSQSLEELKHFLVLLSSLFSGGIKSESELLDLVSMGERVEVLVVLMTSVESPGLVWNFVVEKSAGVSREGVVKSEPVEWVGWSTSWSILHWSPFGVEFVHGFVPSGSSVNVEFPSSISVFGLGPVWSSDTLEHGSGSSSKSNSSHSLKEGMWVEVLGINVHEGMLLLKEFHGVEVLNSHTVILAPFNVEFVSNIGQVWRSEFKKLSNCDFNTVSWVKHQFNNP